MNEMIIIILLWSNSDGFCECTSTIVSVQFIKIIETGKTKIAIYLIQMIMMKVRTLIMYIDCKNLDRLIYFHDSAEVIHHKK